MKLPKMRFSPYLEWVLKLKRHQIHLKGAGLFPQKASVQTQGPQILISTDSNFKLKPLLHMNIKVRLKNIGKNMQALIQVGPGTSWTEEVKI